MPFERKVFLESRGWSILSYIMRLSNKLTFTFLFCFKSHRLNFISKARAPRNRDFEAAKIVVTDQPLRDQQNQNDWKSRRRGHCRPWSRRRAHLSGVWVLRIEDRGTNNASSSIQSRKYIATDVMASWIGFSMDQFSAKLALKSVFLASKKKCRFISRLPTFGDDSLWNWKRAF